MTRRMPATVLHGGAGHSPVAQAAAPAAAGFALLATGSALAWMLATTSLLHRLADPFARGSSSPAAWMVAACLGGAAAIGCVVAGAARVGFAVDRVWVRGMAGRLVSKMAHRLPRDCAVYPAVWLPDGRRLTEVVVGPFGAVVFAPMPLPGRLRHLGPAWEERADDGTWHPVEHPAQRVLRDAERLRHLLAGEERDFVVRVQAAIVGSEVEDQASGVATVRPEDVPAWLTALRPQRSLDRHRLGQVQEWIARLT